MSQLRDEYGNLLPLTDEFGNPVQLTDEHGIPVHVTGIATKERPTLETVIKGDVVEETGFLASTTAGTGGDALKDTEPSVEQGQGELKTEGHAEIQRSSSSSSSGSSEDDGEGGRRKKKGLRQKLKEKLNIGKHKEEHKAEQGGTATVGGTERQHVQEQPHEKKSVIEKIKEKLPGHHSY